MTSLSIRWYLTLVVVSVSIVSLAAGTAATVIDQQHRREDAQEAQADIVSRHAANELTSLYYRTEGRLLAAGSAMDDPPSERGFSAAIAALQLLDDAVVHVTYQDTSNTWHRPAIDPPTGPTVTVTVDEGNFTATFSDAALQGIVMRQATALGDDATGGWSADGQGAPVSGLGGRVVIEAPSIPLLSWDSETVVQATGTGLAVAGASAVGGALAATMLVRPLRRLDQHAKELANGQRPPEIRGPAEVRAIAQNLAHAADGVATERRDFFQAQQSLGAEVNRHAKNVAYQERQLQRLFEGISHDIKGPLISATVLLQAHSRETLDPNLERGLAALDRLRRLVGRLELLSWATLPCESRSVPVVDCVVAALDRLKMTSMAHGRRTEVSGGEAFVMADEERLSLALQMLLENAIVHGGHTRVHWHVGDVVRITVTDRGHGFKFTEEVFEPFAIRRDTPGIAAGLGLPIAHRLVRGMGGGLQLESRPSGTKCTIILPRPA